MISTFLSFRNNLLIKLYQFSHYMIWIFIKWIKCRISILKYHSYNIIPKLHKSLFKFTKWYLFFLKISYGEFEIILLILSEKINFEKPQNYNIFIIYKKIWMNFYLISYIFNFFNFIHWYIFLPLYDF